MRSQRLAIVIPEDSPVNDALRLAGINRGPDVIQTLDEGVKVLLAGEPSDSCGSTC
jgi:hypothetical protein